MLTSDKGKVLTKRQLWWRQQRLPEVERLAQELITRHEALHGHLPGCVIQPEVLLRTLECSLVYFSDQEREEYGIPDDAIGALKPYQHLVFVHDSISSVGREGQTIGEEIGHFVLHAKGVVSVTQQSLFEAAEPSSEGPTFFCRSESQSYVDGEREPAWMSREAAFFGACLQMPRDRYLPVAKRRLIECIGTQLDAPWVESLQGKLQRAHAYAELCRNSGYQVDEVNLLMPGVFDNCIVEQTLDVLEEDHRGVVSRSAQRRRLVELGLLLDASDVFVNEHGLPKLSRFEFFFLPDTVTSKALGR